MATINGGVAGDIAVNASANACGQANSTKISSVMSDGLQIEGMSGEAGISSFVVNAAINGTVNTSAFRTALVQKVRESLSMHLNNSESFQEDSRVLLFQISQNGTLQLPSSPHEFEGHIGYNLSAGQSQTFTFSGPITLGEHGQLQVSLVPGSNYSVGIQGEGGASVRVNVTAT